MGDRIKRVTKIQTATLPFKYNLKTEEDVEEQHGPILKHDKVGYHDFLVAYLFFVLTYTKTLNCR